MTRSARTGGTTIGILHPGAMGAVVGGVLTGLGHDVLWCGAGRSKATAARADEAGLRSVPTVDELTRACDVLLSIVPPHAASATADVVMHSGFAGTYVDANAVSPGRTRAIGETITKAGARYVDGGIVGGPPRQGGTTWLHLSGPAAEDVAALFAGGPLATNLVSSRIGDASAVKVAFAAWTKGSTALRTAVLGYAATAGVADQLEAQWEAFEPGFWAEGRERAVSVTAKAWRFEGEMHEIADALASAGVPGGFHRAAAEVYRRLGPLRDVATFDVDVVVRALAQSGPGDDTSDG